MPYVDVRSNGDVPKFESMIKLGPVFVLVYADWCGHCKTFKQNMWDEVANGKNRGVNTAAVHYDMVDKTSMRNTPIEGYPTLFEVKPTPKENVSTPVPTPQSKEELEKMVGTQEGENNMMMNSRLAEKNTFTPEPVESLPPNITSDAVVEEKNVRSAVQGGGGVARGGSLLETLLKVSADTAHAIVLTGSAMEISRRLKKRKSTRKHKRSGKKALTRRR